MMDNPFTTLTFVAKWNKHFNKSTPVKRFDFIKNISFVKNPFIPLYTNIGRSMTKGLTYNLVETNESDFKKKVFLIYDIPEYLEPKNSISDSSLGVITIKQYSGFLVNLYQHLDVDSYKKSKFGKSSLSKINKYKRKLESCFNIRYGFYFGEISRETYDLIFDVFNELLEKRFSSKQIHNNNLDPKEWNFYYDVMYDLILEKKASIFVIYDGDKPIGGSINYHSEELAIGAIMAFDTDYSKFYIGFTIISELLEWAMDNKLKVFDFSKGTFNYKKQWSDKKYSFSNHILYDRDHVLSSIIANTIVRYFRLKEYLRAKNINEILHKILFFTKRKKTYVPVEYSVSEVLYASQVKPDEHKILIDSKEFKFLRRPVYDFLYSKSEHIDNIEVYRLVNEEKSFLIVGKSEKQKIQFN